MAREFFKNLPDTTTPLNAQRMNAFLNGEEAMGSIVVDDIRSKNIFDNQWLPLGKRYNNNSTTAFSTTTQDGNVGILNPIKLDRTKKYYYLYTNSSYLTNGIYFYDENGIWTGDRSFTNPNYVMTYPETAYYMTFNIQGVTDINDLKSYEWMIEYVDSPTSTHTGYAPYKEISNKQHYSTDEQVIGTWLGKTLYRKVLQLSTPTAVNTNNYLSIGSNVMVCNYQGLIDNGAGALYPINYKNDSLFFAIAFIYEGTNSQITMCTNNTNFLNKTATIIIEYTKN